jgi:hypothetical protein
VITNGLVALLLANSAVSAIVGTRIQPIPAPEDLTQYPCCTYQVASDVSDYTLTSTSGVTTTRIIFDCFGLRYLDARNLALSIKAALTAYRGALPDGTYVYETQIMNMVDAWDDGSRISRTSVHAVLQYADI